MKYAVYKIKGGKVIQTTICKSRKEAIKDIEMYEEDFEEEEIITFDFKNGERFSYEIGCGGEVLYMPRINAKDEYDINKRYPFYVVSEYPLNGDELDIKMRDEELRIIRKKSK